MYNIIMIFFTIGKLLRPSGKLWILSNICWLYSHNLTPLPLIKYWLRYYLSGAFWVVTAPWVHHCYWPSSSRSNDQMCQKSPMTQKKKTKLNRKMRFYLPVVNEIGAIYFHGYYTSTEGGWNCVTYSSISLLQMLDQLTFWTKSKIWTRCSQHITRRTICVGNRIHASEVPNILCQFLWLRREN